MTIPKPLSPAAQAVDDAAYAAWVSEDNHRSIAAAALRVAVDRSIPEPPDCGPASHEYIRGAEDRQRIIRFRLLAIAAELEQQP